MFLSEEKLPEYQVMQLIGLSDPGPCFSHTGRETVRIGHPSGVMTMVPTIVKEKGEVKVPGVAVQRTARRIMEGTIYVRN